LINRILIVGIGSIGNRHLRWARELFPNADIRVLRHRADIELYKYSNGSFFSIQESITFQPQLAVIASPAPFHIATAQALAEVGVHLLIEKPLSASLGGVTQLLETCKQKNVVLLTGYNLRYLPSLQRFRELLHQNVIGQVLSVRCEIGQYLPSWRTGLDYRLGVSARRELGGGALLELSHEIDYLRWIFGEVDWVKATLSHQSSLELDVEDNAHIIIGFLPLGENKQLIASVSLDFIRHDTTRLCTAIGEKGSMRWDGLTGQVLAYMAGEKEWREVFRHQHQRDDSYLAEWQDFLSCVTESRTPFITGEDGLKVLEIVDAARSSSTSGSQVQVAGAMQPSKVKS